MLDSVEVPIRKTLHQFLNSLYRQLGPVTVWLDVICINQRDVAEQSSQVAMMGVIYIMAKCVYAWLGNGTADTDYAMKYLKQGSEDRKTYDLRHVRAGVKDMFLRQYWTRVWINQECLLNDVIYLVCGATMTELDGVFSTVNGFATTRMDAFSRGRRPLFGDGNDDIAAEKRMRQVESGRKSSRSGTRYSLLGLVKAFSSSNCQDSRDKFYGFRALASDGDRLMVDYSLDTPEVSLQALSIYNWTTFTAWCLSHARRSNPESQTWWNQGYEAYSMVNLIFDSRQMYLLLQIQVDHIARNLTDSAEDGLVLPVSMHQPYENLNMQGAIVEAYGLRNTEVGDLVDMCDISKQPNVTRWRTCGRFDYDDLCVLHFDVETPSNAVISAAFTGSIGQLYRSDGRPTTLGALLEDFEDNMVPEVTEEERQHLDLLRVFRSITRGHAWVCRVTSGVHISRVFLFVLISLLDANWKSIPEYLIDYGQREVPPEDRRCTCVMPSGTVSPHLSPWAIPPVKEQPSA